MAPLDGQAAAIGVFNLTLGNASVEARITAADYQAASALIQPYPGPWPLPTEGVLVFDWDTGQAHKLEGSYRIDVPNYSARLLLLCPISNGWAVIGRTDKYLSPAGVEVIASDARTLSLRLKESSPVVVWSATGTVESPDADFANLGGGLWRATHVRTRDGRMEITRP